MTKGGYKLFQTLILVKTHKGLTETVGVAIDVHVKNTNSKYNCPDEAQNEI